MPPIRKTKGNRKYLQHHLKKEKILSVYEEKHVLYQKYLKELDTFREEPLRLSEKVCRKICDYYIQSKFSSWHNIYDLENGNFVGFVIIGKEFPEKHRDSLRSVAQAYVLPEYRKKGLMTAAVSDYMTRHRGTYSLLILKGNEYAAGFWKRLFEKEGYTEVSLSPSAAEDNTDVEKNSFRIRGNSVRISTGTTKQR